MYIIVIYSRFFAKRYREVLVFVWEMESLECFFDLLIYCVVIKLFVVLNDFLRVVRYFVKIKEVGFFLIYDIYRDMIYIYLFYGRFVKFKEVCKEVELVGFKFDV